MGKLINGVGRMNLIWLYIASKTKLDDKNDSEKEKANRGEGFAFVWWANFGLDIYLISQLSVVLGG